MLIELAPFLVFVAAVLLICVTPGPDMLYILVHGVSQGTRAALVASLGMAAGMLCHTTAVVLGVATLVHSSPVAYQVLRYAGAAYLVYLGLRTLRDAASPQTVTVQDPVPLPVVFQRAAVTNLFNPKILLFYLAFLPQFVEPSAGWPALQLLILGLTFVVLGLLVDSLIGLLSGRIGEWLCTRHRSGAWLHRFAGVVFLGLAARVAIA